MAVPQLSVQPVCYLMYYMQVNPYSEPQNGFIRETAGMWAYIFTKLAQLTRDEMQMQVSWSGGMSLYASWCGKPPHDAASFLQVTWQPTYHRQGP